MSTADEIRALHAKRFAYLKVVYDDAQQSRAGLLQKLPADRIRAQIGVDADEGDRIEEYLKDRGLIKFITFGPTVAITVTGIDYVERALGQPDRPTEYFPAVNVLHIEQVNNSQIQ